MAVFVSASDESAGKTDRDHFFFCGWIAPEEDWSQFFTPAWQERVLDPPPAIPFLHMTEIRSPKWRSQYGLSREQAEARVDKAFDVIDQMGSLFPISISVDAGHVLDKFIEAKVVASSGGKRKFEPDFICFLAYAYVVLSYVNTMHPAAEKVDFVVESKEVITKYIQEFHSSLSNALNYIGRPELIRLVGGLIPGGKERLPLQAADLLCWHTARYHAKTMDAADGRRYAKIAHRAGVKVDLTELVAKFAAALLRPQGKQKARTRRAKLKK
ncbi:MAG TPA: hypothetical protein VI636_06130 [Candidatus Angelobacter sp.]